jgi:small subunit ribosomal protein S2
MINKISLMNLHEAGAHRGNYKSRLNPRLKKYVHMVDSNSMCIVDLNQTIDSLEKACQLMFKLGQKKKQIFIVGTSKYIKDYTSVLSSKFTSEPMPFVNNRWLGGTLTNWSTIKKTLKQLEKLESIRNNTEFYNKLSRNEQLSIDREFEKKSNLFGGLKNLKNNHPGAVLLLDTAKNYNAILESENNNIPLIAFTNLNSILLPKNLDTTIVFNNTSVNAIDIISNQLVEAYNQGVIAANVALQQQEGLSPNNSKTPLQPNKFNNTKERVAK